MSKLIVTLKIMTPRTLTIGVWIITGIIICIYPFSSLFWYSSSVFSLCMGLCWCINLASMRKAQSRHSHGPRSVQPSWSFVLQLFSAALAFFGFGALHIDDLAAHMSLSGRNGFMVIWIGLKVAIEIFLVFLVIQSLTLPQLKLGGFFLHPSNLPLAISDKQ